MMIRLIFSLLIILSIQASSQNSADLLVGSKAIDFKLNTIEGNTVKLSEIYNNQPVVLVVLRGWPDYQCPVCTRQVGQLVSDKDKFLEQKVAVLMVYPGHHRPADY